AIGSSPGATTRPIKSARSLPTQSKKSVKSREVMAGPTFPVRCISVDASEPVVGVRQFNADFRLTGSDVDILEVFNMLVSAIGAPIGHQSNWPTRKRVELESP